MHIHKDQLPNVVTAYLSEVVLPKAPSGIAQFGIGFVLPYLQSSVNQMVSQYESAAKALGIMDESERVDIDLAHKSALSGLERAGGRFVVMGYVIDRSDIDAMRDIANRFGG